MYENQNLSSLSDDELLAHIEKLEQKVIQHNNEQLAAKIQINSL